ncbi:hypothetical protein ABPG74_009554 [Tetrahymena malaccensis]
MDLKQILSFIILTFFVNAKQCYEILNCDICEDIFNCSTCRDGFQWSIKDQACILNCQQNQVTTQNDCENECQIPSFYTDQNSQNLTCQQTLQCPLMHYFGDEYSMYDKPQSFILLENEQYLIVIDLQNFYVLNINNGKKITEKSLQNAIFASAYNSENQEIILIDINNNIFIYNLKMHFLDKFQISKEQSLLRIKKNSFIIPELHSVLLFGQLNDAYLYNYKMKSIIITLPITNIYEQLDIVSYLSLGLNYLDSQIFYFYWIQANIFHVLEVTQIKSEQFSENMIYQQKFQNLQIVNNRFIKSQYINLMKHVIVLFDQAAIYFDIQKKIIQNISLNSCINTTQNITNFQAQNKTFILVNTKNEMCIFGYSSGAQKWELLFKTIGQDILSYFELDSLAKSILILDKTQVINVFQIQPNNTYQLTNQQKIKQYQTTLAIQSKQNSSLFYFLGSDCTILQISNPEWIPHNSSNRQFEFEIQSKLITYSQGKKYNLSDVQTVLINHQQERILIHYSQNNFYQNTQFHLYDGISKKYLRSFQQGVDYEETSNLYQIFEYPKFIVVIFKSGFHILIDIESLMIVDQFVFDQGFTKQNFYNSVYLRNPPQNFEYLFSYSNVILYVYKYDYSKPLNFFKLDFTYQLDNQQGLNHFMFGFIYAIGKYIYITSQIGVNILLFDYTQNFKQLNSYQDQTLNGQMIFIDVLINNNRIIMTYIDGTIALFDINLSLIIKIQMKDEFMTVAWNVKDDLFVCLIIAKNQENYNGLLNHIAYWDAAQNKFEQSIQTQDFLCLLYIPQQQLLYGIQFQRSITYSEFYQTNKDNKNDTQVIYISHSDSNQPYSMFINSINDEILIGNWKNNAQINQNFKNFYRQIEFSQNETIQKVFFTKKQAYIVIHTNLQLLVQSIYNWSIIYKNDKTPFIQIVQSDLDDGIIAGFTRQGQIIVWNLYNNQKKNYQSKSQDLYQIFYLQDLIIITLKSKGNLIICNFQWKADSQLECEENAGFNNSQITQLKMDYQMGYVFSLSQGQIVIQNINEDLSTFLLNQIFYYDQYTIMLIDEINQRLFVRSQKQITAYTYQGLFIQQITEPQNEYLIIDFLLGANIFLYYTDQGFFIFDRYSLIFLANQSLNYQIIQIIIMENLNQIAYITSQRNVGSIHLFSVETLSSESSKIQVLASRASLLTIKMYYDEQNMYLITVNEAGDIIIWEMSKSSQLASYKQYLTNKSLNQNIKNINILLDNQNNYFISHNDKTLILWEYSHYISKGGEYETLPIKYEIPHVYDYNRNILLISDENKNVFMYSNNQYQYIKEFQTDLRGIFKLTGLPSQSSDEYYYFAYDFQHSYILSSNLNIINIKQNTFTSLCKQITDSDGNQNSFIFSSRKGSTINLLQLISVDNIICEACQGAFLYVNYPTTKFTIKDSVFQNCLSNIGGVMYLKLNNEQTFGYLFINNTLFSFNTAIQYGGALLLDSTDLELFQTNFTFNKAQIGGAIRYLKLKPKFTFDLKDEQNIKKIFFEDNQASIYGQNFTSVPFYLQYNILESDNNDVNQLTNLFFKSFKNYDIKREFDNYIIQLIAKQNSIFLENNFIVIKADKESLIFKNVVVTGIPLTDQIFYIQAPFLYSLDESNGIVNVLKEYPINIKFRNCKQGEYYQESSGQRIKCNVCQNVIITFILKKFNVLQKPFFYSNQQNTYSLVDIPPDIVINDIIQCKPCPDSADYCYGNIIQVKKGYWRINNNSDVIVYCKDNPGNCVGYTDYKNGTYCKQGYIGPLCEQCDSQGDLWEKRYTFVSSQECGECDIFNTYIRQIIILIGLTLYIIISLNLAHKIYKKIAIVYYLRMMNMISFGNSILSSNSQVYVKQLIHYLQIAYTINNVQFNLPFQITTASDFIGNPVNFSVIALGCMVPTQIKIPLVYVMAILSTIIPIIICLLILIIYYTVSIPSVCGYLISIISCYQIGTKQYVVADYTLECFTPEYFTYAVTIFNQILKTKSIDLLDIDRNGLILFENESSNNKQCMRSISSSCDVFQQFKQENIMQQSTVPVLSKLFDCRQQKINNLKAIELVEQDSKILTLSYLENNTYTHFKKNPSEKPLDNNIKSLVFDQIEMIQSEDQRNQQIPAESKIQMNQNTQKIKSTKLIKSIQQINQVNSKIKQSNITSHRPYIETDKNFEEINLKSLSLESVLKGKEQN